MIKINLLREPTPKGRQTWSPEKSQVGIYAIILMFLAVAGMAWWYWHLLGERTEYTGELEQLQQENMRLIVVKAELDKFERHKKLLENRIGVIEQLKSNQKGPVILMNAVIASVPAERRLWLQSISQKESEISIKGEATDVTSLADFITRLSANPPFKQVELNEYQEDNDRITFELSCQIGS